MRLTIVVNEIDCIDYHIALTEYACFDGKNIQLLRFALFQEQFKCHTVYLQPR